MSADRDPKLSTDFRIGDHVRVIKERFADEEETRISDLFPFQTGAVVTVDHIVEPKDGYPVGLVGVKGGYINVEPEHFELDYRPLTREEHEAERAAAAKMLADLRSVIHPPLVIKAKQGASGRYRAHFAGRRGPNKTYSGWCAAVGNVIAEHANRFWEYHDGIRIEIHNYDGSTEIFTSDGYEFIPAKDDR